MTTAEQTTYYSTHYKDNNGKAICGHRYPQHSSTQAVFVTCPDCKTALAVQNAEAVVGR